MHPSTFCRCRLDKDPRHSFENAAAINPRNVPESSSGGRTKRSVAEHGKLWKNGSTLKISFLGAPNADTKDAIIDLATKWLPYGNLRFRFMKNNTADVDIAILTSMEKGLINECSIGTDCRLDRPHESMVLTAKPDQGDVFIATVLHEFGHALGALHEHQHPEAQIPWNKQRIHEFYANSSGWSPEDVEKQFFQRLAPGGLLSPPYDPLSIMHYPLDPQLTDGAFEVKLNTELSEKDKRFMSLAYPY
ncbi:TPA: peptidase M12 [Pseudomonas putida]